MRKTNPNSAQTPSSTEFAALFPRIVSGELRTERFDQTNPIEANAKLRFHAENAEILAFITRAGDETNPMRAAG
jgi:hypothetical protein